MSQCRDSIWMLLLCLLILFLASACVKTDKAMSSQKAMPPPKAAAAQVADGYKLAILPWSITGGSGHATRAQNDGIEALEQALGGSSLVPVFSSYALEAPIPHPIEPLSRLIFCGGILAVIA